MAIVSCKHCADDPVFICSNEKQTIINGYLALNRSRRLIMAGQIGKHPLPKRHDSVIIGEKVHANFHLGAIAIGVDNDIMNQA
ncbi:MAG: hypothetical protein AAF722_05480 [Cyanobacteria bacterium P01_C01_bin.70]